MSKAIFPGTFDPITLGHESLIHRVAGVFDEIIVGVAAGVHKEASFSLDERLEMTAQSFQKIDRIRVLPFHGLLADFLSENDCRIILRGLRAVSDFDFEVQLSHINKSLDPRIETMFLSPSNEYIHLSSTVVREIAQLGGDITKFVSPHVAKALWRKVGHHGT